MGAVVAAFRSYTEPALSATAAAAAAAAAPVLSEEPSEEPSEELALAAAAVGAGKAGDDVELAPLEEGAFSINLGIPVIIVCAKVCVCVWVGGRGCLIGGFAVLPRHKHVLTAHSATPRCHSSATVTTARSTLTLSRCTFGT
jgi:hypothetical protein